MNTFFNAICFLLSCDYRKSPLRSFYIYPYYLSIIINYCTFAIEKSDDMKPEINSHSGRQLRSVTKILFVCLGNICRSPAAQGVMQSLIDKQGLAQKFELDSCGFYGGHAGELPDKRMRVHAVRRGYELTHRSRTIRPWDFDEADIIVAMDGHNYDDLMDAAPSPEAQKKVVMMTDFCRLYVGHDIVPDPYYEGAEGFELVLDLLEDACAGLLDAVCEGKI